MTMVQICSYSVLMSKCIIYTFSDPSSKPAAAIVPFGDRAQDRAQGERGNTLDFSKTAPVSTNHTLRYMYHVNQQRVKKKV